MRAVDASKRPVGDPDPITVRVPTALRMLGLSRSKFYMLLADGEFEIIKVGRCTLVVVASLHRFVSRQRN
jgi:excisionase family DNA binding protein